MTTQRIWEYPNGVFYQSAYPLVHWSLGVRCSWRSDARGPAASLVGRRAGNFAQCARSRSTNCGIAERWRHCQSKSLVQSFEPSVEGELEAATLYSRLSAEWCVKWACHCRGIYIRMCGTGGNDSERSKRTAMRVGFARFLSGVGPARPDGGPKALYR